MDAKAIEKEITRIMDKATAGTEDVNEIMNRVVTKYNLSADLVEGWLEGWLSKHVQIDKIMPDEMLLAIITPDTPNSVMKALKNVIDSRGLSKRIFYAPDINMIEKIDKKVLVQYIDFLQHALENTK